MAPNGSPPGSFHFPLMKPEAAMNRTCPFEGTRSRSHFLSLRIGLAILAVIVSPVAAVAQTDHRPPSG